MNKKCIAGYGLGMFALMSGCGSSSSDAPEVVAEQETVEEVVEEVVEGQIYGPFSTGSTSESKSVYFDLETAQVVELTDEEAAADSQWDIAFNRTKVSMNTHVDNKVGVYMTDVNSDFFAEDGSVDSEKFLNATAETELEDYVAIQAADLPSEDAYSYDSEEYVIGGKFYSYDMTTHVASAKDDAYFIVSSDDAYTKFRAKTITTSGRVMDSITLGIQHQSELDGQTEFAEEKDLTIEILNCTADVYVDFDLAQVVTQDDAWDITIPCMTVSDVTGGGFEIFIADDATALEDSENSFTGIDSQTAQYYGFKANQTEVQAFAAKPWYQYNLNGGHLLWSQYGVYIVKTNTATYKLQITSYYDESGTSGNYSFRFDEVSAE